MINRLWELLQNTDVQLAILCGLVAVGFGLIDALLVNKCDDGNDDGGSGW